MIERASLSSKGKLENGEHETENKISNKRIESDKRDTSEAIYSKVGTGCGRSPGGSGLINSSMQEALGMVGTGTDHGLLRWHALRGVDWH